MSVHEDMAATGIAPELPPDAPQVQLRAVVDGAEVTCEASGPVTIIGSRRDCSLSLAHPEVSKLHAAIIHTGRRVLVRDLCSRSGTQRGGEEVGLAEVQSGDVLSLGGVEVEVTIAPTEGEAGDGALEFDPPLVLDGAGGRFEVRAIGALVGHRNNCDVVLESVDVSLVHALLIAIDGQPAVFDLGSRSGTYVNDAPITSVWLRAGDRLRIGQEAFEVCSEGASAESGDAELAAELAAPPPPVASGGPTAEADPGLEPAAVASAVTSVVERAGADGNDNLGDLAVSLAGLQAQVNSARAALEARATELEELQHDLTARESALAADIAALGAERASFEQEQATFADQITAIEQHHDAVAAERAELDARQTDLAALDTELKTREQTLAAQREEIESREQAIGEREAAVEAREAAIAEQVNAMAARQAELAQREQAENEAAAKVAQFKEALRQASQTFAKLTPEADEETPAPLISKPILGGNPAASPDPGAGGSVRDRLARLRRPPKPGGSAGAASV